MESTLESNRYATLLLDLAANEISPMTAGVTCVSELLDGPIHGLVDFKIDMQELREAYDAIWPANRQSPSRRGPAHLLDPIKDLGGRLFNALFQNDIGYAYRACVSAAEDRNVRLRICISCPPQTNLEELPWEFLYDPLRNDFVALSSRRAIIRQLMRPGTTDPSTLESLRVAFIASPDPNKRLELDRDRQLLQAMVSAHPQRLSVVDLGDATPQTLRDAVSAGDYDIVHFAGKGIDLRPSDDLSRQALVVQGSKEADLFLPEVLRAPSLSSPNGIRLLFLSACNTHRFAERVASFIPSVIGMRGLVSVDFCLTFTNEFYRAVLAGVSVEEAVTAARVASDTVNPGGREWGMAALCTSTQGPAYLLGSAPQPSRARIEEMSSPATSDPGREREWRKLTQLLEVHRRNSDALQKVLDDLTNTEGTAEAVRTINQGSVEEVRQKISTVNESIADIQSRMRLLQ